MSEEEYLQSFPDQKLDFSKGPPGKETDWQKPVVSDGMGCTPRRIKDFEELTAKHGFPTDFTTHRGRPIVKNRAHRRQLMRMLKVHDNNGGYSD